MSELYVAPGGDELPPLEGAPMKPSDATGVLEDALLASPQEAVSADLTAHTDQVASEMPDKPDYNYWSLPGESPRLYERLGVRWFKKWLPTTGDVVRRRLHIKPGGLSGMADARYKAEHVIKASKVFESVHLGGVAMFGIQQYMAVHNGITDPLTHSKLIAAQIGVNIYPIMLQRYNRQRAIRVLGKLSARAMGQSDPS
ncbi:MAG TPA: hypothetical protein VLA92_00960, partial [Candidatus Saccharimonadales bacterium]|nr:hypothetical protein [Candidatus Saccharimonadales bacterium]